MSTIIYKDTEITSTNLTINSPNSNSVHFGQNNNGRHLLFGPALGHSYEFTGNSNNTVITHGNVISKNDFYTNIETESYQARRLVGVQEINNDTDVTTTSISSVLMSAVFTYTPLYSNSIIVVDTESNVYTSNTGTDDDFVSRWNFSSYNNNTGTTILNSASSEDIYDGASNYDPDSMIIHSRLSFNIIPQRSSDGNVYLALRGFCSNDTSGGWAMLIAQYYTTLTIQEYV